MDGRDPVSRAIQREEAMAEVRPYSVAGRSAGDLAPPAAGTERARDLRRRPSALVLCDVTGHLSSASHRESLQLLRTEHRVPLPRAARRTSTTPNPRTGHLVHLHVNAAEPRSPARYTAPAPRTRSSNVFLRRTGRADQAGRRLRLGDRAARLAAAPDGDDGRRT